MTCCIILVFSNNVSLRNLEIPIRVRVGKALAHNCLKCSIEYCVGTTKSTAASARQASHNESRMFFSMEKEVLVSVY